MSGSSPQILPTAYLIPGSILDRMSSTGPAGTSYGGELYKDLRDFGGILSIFSRYLPAEPRKTCKKLSQELGKITPEITSDELYRIADDLASLMGFEGKTLFPLSGRDITVHPYRTAMNTVRETALKTRDGEKHLIIVSGNGGEGKTTFLMEIAAKLETEWKLKGNGIISDQATFRDFDESEEEGRCDYIIFDDHNQDSLLCGYIIDRLSRDFEKHDLTIVATGGDTPEWFVTALESEAGKKDLEIIRITIPQLDDETKRKTVLDLLPAQARSSAAGSFDSGDSFALLEVKARLIQDSGTRERKGKRSVLATLSAEEKSVLNFISNFRFDVPLSLLKGVFSIEESNFYAILHRLIALGIVTMRTEKSCFNEDKLCTVFRIRSGSIARTIEESISAQRRRELHRNIAQILKEIPGIPSIYIFYHLARCGDLEEAAFRGLVVFQLLLGRKRLHAINCFNEGFMSLKLERHLPVETRLKLLLDLGNYYSTIGLLEKAENLYRKCREETKKEAEWQSHRGLAVEAIRKECEILEKRGDFTRAENLLKKALEEHGEHIVANERAKLYNDLAWVHYRLGQFDKSWENCLLVHKLLDKKQYPMELAQSYNLMGAINWNRSKYDEAILCHKRCLALREDCNDELGVAASFNNLGLVYRSMGKVKDALESFTKSMRIKQRNNNLPGLAAVHLNLALAYIDKEELDKAESSCMTAIRLAEDIGNQQLLAEICGTLGEIHFQKGDHGKARDSYFRDLHICHKTRSIREKAVVMRRLGELSLIEGKVIETKELLDEARELNGKIGSRLETALLDLLEGRILLAEGKREQGKLKLEETGVELSLLGRKGTAASVASEIGELYLEEGNEPLAREYLLRAISLVGETEKMPGQVLQLQEHLEERISLEAQEILTDSARFRALCRVISLIRTIHDPDKLHMTITETVRKITQMERAALILQMDGQDTYRILASVGDFDSESILTDKNIIAVLNMARQLGYLFDISRTRMPPDKVSDEFLKSHRGIICMPLWIQDEVTGYLYLDSPGTTTWSSDEDHTFLVAFSQQIALGLERMLLSNRISKLEQPKPTPNASISRTSERVTFQDIVGKSAAVRHLYELIDGIKDMNTTVLLTGPNGSGKDLIAKTIHYTSPRSDKTFHTLNCSAFPRELIESELFGHERGAFTGAYKKKIGHFESASDGTIFLNEIGDIPLSLQPKLLQVLEDRKFFRVGGTSEIHTDARIICATNKDLIGLVKEGKFREDLYYRINIFPIRVPGLSERREDIKLLCNHFLTTYCRLYNIPTKRISPEAMAYLNEYDWPGNVRELENTINRLIIISKKDTILPEDLPEDIVRHRESVEKRSLSTLEDIVESILDSVDFAEGEPMLRRVKETLISKVVEKTGDKTKAAQVLGISKPTLYNHLKSHDKKHNR
jgi:transcriptional regulator with GAF, ATPase, and Fis domain/tetratricopeptide (TPR) repeat protein